MLVEETRRELGRKAAPHQCSAAGTRSGSHFSRKITIPENNYPGEERSSLDSLFLKRGSGARGELLPGLEGPRVRHPPKKSISLHPSSESAHLTCSSNLVITAWTHSTGLCAAMAGGGSAPSRGVRRCESRSCRAYLWMKICPDSMREDGRGRVFFSPFCRLHHATAMTHHRKSSSGEATGGGGGSRRVKLAWMKNTTPHPGGISPLLLTELMSNLLIEK